MSSVFSAVAVLLGLIGGPAPPLRVCSGGDSLPYSTPQHDGLDDRVAAIVAADLGRAIEFVAPARRSVFVRAAGERRACDLVMGVPEGTRDLLTTTAYYRSSYVFVSRRAVQPPLTSFDDPRLRGMRIGIQLVGDEGGAAPTTRALARRQLSGQVRGFPVLGNAARPDAQGAIVQAVATGAVDAAAVWGPIGGYFAALSRPPLQVSLIEPGPLDGTTYAFAIAIGVQPSQRGLRDRVNAALARHSAGIDRVIRAFHVPQARRRGAAAAGRS
jgi:mxaJ protein